MTITCSTFYKFVHVAERETLQADLKALCLQHGVKGTILVAHEGINSTLAGEDADVRAVLAWLRADPRFADLVSKESYTEAMPFRKMKVRLKREIVTFGAPEADPNRCVGRYVKPAEWNRLITDPDVIVLDTRNDYEVAIGTFDRAIDPKTRKFSDLKSYVAGHLDPKRDRKIAMFCTGGIRCERASAWFLTQGFPEVYHLEGGILKYLEDVPPEDSLWRGECFVFDERVALEHGVVPGKHGMCKACGWPIEREGRGSGGSAETCAHCGTPVSDCAITS